MSNDVNSTRSQSEHAEESLSGCNSSTSTDKNHKDNNNDSEEDSPVNAKRRKTENSIPSDREVLRFKPLSVRIGSYIAPIHGEVEFNSDGFIFPTSTVQSKNPRERTENIRIELETTRIAGIWAYLCDQGGSHCVIVYTTSTGARNIRTSLNMPKVHKNTPGSIPFIHPWSSNENRRRILIYLDVLQCGVVSAKLRELFGNRENKKGKPLYREISWQRAEQIITRAFCATLETDETAEDDASSSEDEEVPLEDVIGNLFKTTCLCIICKKTPEKAVLCQHCTRIFCMECFSKRRNCPLCFKKVKKASLEKCGWVEKLVAYLKSTLHPTAWLNVDRTETLEKARQCLWCQVCYMTLEDAVLCPHCLKIFCRECIKESLTAKYPSCSWCLVDLTKKDLVPCPWGERMGRSLDLCLDPGSESSYDSRGSPSSRYPPNYW